MTENEILKQQIDEANKWLYAKWIKMTRDEERTELGQAMYQHLVKHGLIK